MGCIQNRRQTIIKVAKQDDKNLCENLFEKIKKDKEMLSEYRWAHPLLTDFTEEFLIKTMEQNNFQLAEQYPTDNKAVILYDFRRSHGD